jgi:hypothetical protein
MLGRGLFGAYHHRVEGQSRFRDLALEDLGRSLSAQSFPRVVWEDLFDPNTERGPVVRLEGGLREAQGQHPGGALASSGSPRADDGGRRDGETFATELEDLPVFRLSAIGGIMLTMTGEQLVLFAGALSQIIRRVQDFEFSAIFGWTRWEMRDLEARLVEVLACLDLLDAVPEGAV